jgi:peptide/histidine transporter 3/4
MKANHFKTGEILAAICISLPIGGWLADAYVGRYRAIKYGMWIMWFGAILNGFSLVLSKVSTPYKLHGYQWVTHTINIITGVGFGAYQANIVQFGIDQLIDATSTEISSFIMWYTMSLSICGIAVNYSSFCTQDYVVVLVVALCLTLAIGLDYLLKHWLDKDPVIRGENPLCLISKTVCFTIKNRRSLLPSQQHHGVLTNFDVAKRVYAGPFTHEQVEDVKTFFRVLLVIAVFMMTCSGLPVVNNVCDKLVQYLQNWPEDTNLRGCYEQLSVYYVNYTFLLVVFVVYQVIINPFFHACIPRVKITTRFFCSVLLFLAGVLSLLGIESSAYIHQLGQNDTIKCVYQIEHGPLDVNYYWMIIPNMFNGLSTFLFVFSGLEFICAQAPLNMKGLVIGTAYSLYGVGCAIQVAMSIPFIAPGVKVLWERVPLTCGVWYFMMQGLIITISSLMVAVMITTYKRRKRMNVLSQDDWQQISSPLLET